MGQNQNKMHMHNLELAVNHFSYFYTKIFCCHGPYRKLKTRKIHPQVLHQHKLLNKEAVHFSALLHLNNGQIIYISKCFPAAPTAGNSTSQALLNYTLSEMPRQCCPQKEQNGLPDFLQLETRISLSLFEASAQIRSLISDMLGE